MGVFSRSWEITKLSFDVIKKDKELLLFPLLAGIFSIVYILAMLFPSLITGLLKGTSQGLSTTHYLFLFLTYLGLAFVATFFNVCVVYTTKKRFEGGNATFGKSIGYAFSKFHLILLWSIVAATVGLILRIIDRMAEKLGQTGKVVVKILNSILGMVWSILTIFVVPSMVYYNLGPIDAIKKSVETLRKTWGESLVRYYGLGLIQFLFIFIGIIIAIPLIIVLANLGVWGVFTAVSIAVLYFIAVILVFSVANSVFNTALYVYADTGKIPQGYSKDIMQNAFKRKGVSSMRGGVI